MGLLYFTMFCAYGLAFWFGARMIIEDDFTVQALTDTGLEKKFATGLCVPSWTFRSAPLSSQLLGFQRKIERENSHGL